MRPLPPLLLGVLLILAGCTAGPFGGQEDGVTVDINNSANVTHTFEIWVADGALDDKEVIIRKEGGEVDRASPGAGLSTYKLDDDYGRVTSIELPPNQSHLHGEYTLAPGENNRSSIADFETGSTVLVVISNDDRVVSLVTAHCGGDLASLEVTMFHYGSGSAYDCQGGLF